MMGTRFYLTQTKGWIGQSLAGARFIWLMVVAAALAIGLAAAEAKDKPKAELKISGYGLAGNFALKRLLTSLDLDWKEREFFDANFIEDSALILLSQLQQDGYLKPVVESVITLESGGEMKRTWRRRIEEPLERPLRATRVHFRLDPGVLYRYGDSHFEGLTLLKSKTARSYFVETGVLLPLKKTRIFTPRRLENSLDALTDELALQGYQEAEAGVLRMEQDDKAGIVNLTIDVDEGLKSRVRGIRVNVFSGTNGEPVESYSIETNTIYSGVWEQDFKQELKNRFYRDGYPDTTVEITKQKREVQDGVAELELLAEARTGTLIRVGDVIFEGRKKTKRSVLDRRVRVFPGNPLDRIAVDQGRFRLSKLGIFDSVGVRYDVVDETTRNVVYTLDEGRTLDFSVLFGYGSYELLRAGFELEQFNLFGRAHHSRLRAIQSFKASSADYLYTMPEFVGEDVDLFLQGTWLRREEVSFTREEFGGATGARVFLDSISSDFSARYQYQVLSAVETGVAAVGPLDATVGSVILELQHDQRDSPLYPREGYKIFSGLELASEFLGGDVDFARLEFQAAVHQPVGEGRWVHLGLSHSVAATVNGSSEDLPFNKRFFPGGENSVRGFQFGEAAPLDDQGRVIGAETYTAANVEFEQALTEKISLVVFTDVIGFGQRLGDYPGNEILLSAGGGLRWKTLIGPVRLEYGHNLIKRDTDPAGTLHFSIGFPF